jgi:hypothetical protein
VSSVSKESSSSSSKSFLSVFFVLFDRGHLFPFFFGSATTFSMLYSFDD